jgi:hypothetical protein
VVWGVRDLSDEVEGRLGQWFETYIQDGKDIFGPLEDWVPTVGYVGLMHAQAIAGAIANGKGQTKGKELLGRFRTS